MDLTLIKVVNAYDALQRIKNRTFPIKIAYAINKNMQLFKGDVDFYKKNINDIYNQYLEKDIKGNFITVSETKDSTSFKIKEGMDLEMGQKMKELNETEINIDVYMISLNMLMELNIDIEPSVLNNIDFILQD